LVFKPGRRIVALEHLDVIVNVVMVLAAYLITRPLMASIRALEKTVDRLATVVDELRKDMNNAQINIKEIEQISKSAQDRCVAIEQETKELEKRLRDVELHCGICNDRR
jgi:chromosome segregation ATPase